MMAKTLAISEQIRDAATVWCTYLTENCRRLGTISETSLRCTFFEA
jgi:hypothetical protein